MDAPLKIFAGSSHTKLAQDICDNLGVPLGESDTLTFSNENMMVQINENVRECDVFVIQTSCSPVHTNLVELLLMIDALRSSSAARITAVMPYFPYIRSDKKDRPRISIAARLMADLVTSAGAHRVLTMDLHSPQSQGFFRIPVDQLLAAEPLCERISQEDISNWVLVAADAGEAKDIGRYANHLNLPIAIIDKRRDGDDEKPRAVNLIGDVKGKTALVVDDEIASGGTLSEAAAFLKEQGATRVIAAATHAVFSSRDIQKRLSDEFIERIIVTDTIPIPADRFPAKAEVISVADLFSKAISRIHDGRSVSALF